MWVFTTIGFFSIVAHRDRPGFVLVRARDNADLNALVQRLPLPRPTVQRTPNADYLFRVVVEKQAMARVLESLAEGIDYENFKDAVAKAQGASRAKIYHDVWHALLPLQQPAVVRPRSTKEDPDAGMIPTAEDLAADARLSARAARAARPEFNPSDYATEAEMLAALRARMGDAQFERFWDQSRGEDIRFLDDTGKEI